MGRLQWVMAIVLLYATVPIGVGQGGNDAGRGEDAPNTWQEAWDVEPGVINGTTVGQYDWYRLIVPPGQVLTIMWTSSVPGTWNDLRILEDDGVGVGWYNPNNRFKIGSSTGALRLGMEGFWNDMDYSIEVGLEDAPQNDDGLGIDFGNHWQHATTLTSAGIVQGSFDVAGGDVGDWVRFPIGPAQWARVTVTSVERYVDVAVHEDGGKWVASESNSEYTETFEVQTASGALLVGVYDSFVSSAYTIKFDVFDRSDLGVTNLTVEQRNLVTDWTELPIPVRGFAYLDLANTGAGDSRDTWVRLVGNSPGADTADARVLYDGPIDDLAAGDTRAIALQWDSTGIVGEFTVEAWVTGMFDIAGPNDSAQNMTEFVAPGLGGGIDLLNHRAAGTVVPPAGDGHSYDLRVDYDVDWWGLSVFTATPGRSTDVQAGLTGSGDPEVAFRTCQKLPVVGCVSS